MSDAVLVTGGAGYIGSHVSKALADAGLTPVCYDTLEKGHEWAVRWGPLERGDIGDAARLDEVFARHKPRAIIHIAGYIEVGESVRQPERYMHNNATKTVVLVEAALRHGIEAFVFSSTLRRLRPAAVRPAGREASDRADQSLCRVEGEGRGHPHGVLQRVACARRRCAISMPRAPTPGARSARRTRRKPICCRSRSMPCLASVRRSPCWATTIRRPTAPACATISM